MNIVYFNGQFINQDEAKVSIMDRGFLFGDSVYEVIPFFNNEAIELDAHLARLTKSLSAIHMTAPLSKEDWQKVLATLFELNKLDASTHDVYIQVTRGADTHRSHLIPQNLPPTVLAFCKQCMPSTTPDDRGHAAITLQDTRRKHCHIKSTCLLPNILLMEQARQAGAFEAILIKQGYAIEATSSNLFIVQQETIITPPLSPNILAGVTRKLVIKLCQQFQLDWQEANITEQQLRTADEIWLTGSSKEICAITTLDQQPVGTGKIGPMWKKINNLYQNYKQSMQCDSISKN